MDYPFYIGLVLFVLFVLYSLWLIYKESRKIDKEFDEDIKLAEKLEAVPKTYPKPTLVKSDEN